MEVMFTGASSLTSLDVSGWNTSNVTNMDSMFSGASSLTSLDVSGWDTSSVTNMNFMFRDASSLSSLSTYSWNTNNVVSMVMMFRNTNLRTITLGRDFRFIGNAFLPPIYVTEGFTGRWQHIGTGTIDNPLGEFVFSSAELMEQFNGATMAGTFVWQRVVTQQPPVEPPAGQPGERPGDVNQPPPSTVERDAAPTTGDSLPIGSVIYMWFVSLVSLVMVLILWKEKKRMMNRR
jgi:surface protein